MAKKKRKKKGKPAKVVVGCKNIPEFYDEDPEPDFIVDSFLSRRGIRRDRSEER